MPPPLPRNRQPTASRQPADPMSNFLIYLALVRIRLSLALQSVVAVQGLEACSRQMQLRTNQQSPCSMSNQTGSALEWQICRTGSLLPVFDSTSSCRTLQGWLGFEESKTSTIVTDKCMQRGAYIDTLEVVAQPSAQQLVTSCRQRFLWPLFHHERNDEHERCSARCHLQEHGHLAKRHSPIAVWLSLKLAASTAGKDQRG